MREILFATDFSERSDRALRRAVLIARATGANVTLLHVVDDDRPRRIIDRERDLADELLREQVHTLATVDGIASRAEVVLGSPTVGLAKASEESAYDLLILGQHRRQPIRDAFVGTTAERTIRQVRIPVLVVSGPPVSAYRRVVVATDLLENSRGAADKFARLGVCVGARTTLLHVFFAPALRLTMGHTTNEDARKDILYIERKNALGAGNPNCQFIMVPLQTGAKLRRHMPAGRQLNDKVCVQMLEFWQSEVRILKLFGHEPRHAFGEHLNQPLLLIFTCRRGRSLHQAAKAW